MKHITSALCLTITLAGCAHHDDVRPSASNVHYIAVNAQQKEDGPHEALRQANHYCSSLGKKMYVINEDISYQGEQPEEQYLNQLGTAEIVSGVGTLFWIFGDGKVDDAGGVATIAGESVKAALGKPYLTKMQFRCD